MKHIVFDCDGTLIDTNKPGFLVFHGIKELVEELARENKLYVWTMRDRISTTRILKENGIFHLFEGLATVSDGPPKPRPAGIQAILGDIPNTSVCVIGDSSGDMNGAKGLGVLGIGAIWNGMSAPEYLKEAGADFIVSHPSECSRLIQENLIGA